MASCQVCAKELRLKPPRPRSGRRYREGAAGPVRVVLEGGIEAWFCWPKCWKKAHPEKPGKAKRKKQIKLRGSKTSPRVEEEAA